MGNIGEPTVSETAKAEVGRYQIVAVGKQDAVLLDTATGSSWSLARDVDTLQLGWQPLEEQWPDTAVRPEPNRAQARSDLDDSSADWWRPRFGPKWSRPRQRGT